MLKYHPYHPDPYLALSVAAAMAYGQLSEKRPVFYDVEHFSEVLNVAAQALIRAVPIYVADAGRGARRRLAYEEALHAAVTRGATVVVLANGRRLTGVSLLRSDFRGAVAALRRTGIKGFIPARFSEA